MTILERVLRKGKREGAVVVTFRHGRPSRVFGLKEYDATRSRARENEPWKSRVGKAKDPIQDLLWHGTVKSKLGRDEIYDR